MLVIISLDGTPKYIVDVSELWLYCNFVYYVKWDFRLAFY